LEKKSIPTKVNEGFKEFSEFSQSIDEPPVTELLTPQTPEDKKEELLKYVMNDMDMDMDMDMDTEHFGEKKHKTGSIPVPNDDFEPEYNIACDAQNLIKPDDFERKKSKKPKQKNNSYFFINEYKNESGLNGGQLLGGLDGYDMYDSVYQEYSCNSKI
jgi:hypothetical protein